MAAANRLRNGVCDASGWPEGVPVVVEDEKVDAGDPPKLPAIGDCCDWAVTLAFVGVEGLLALKRPAVVGDCVGVVIVS